jgi:hypothetical protein
MRENDEVRRSFICGISDNAGDSNDKRKMINEMQLVRVS